MSPTHHITGGDAFSFLKKPKKRNRTKRKVWNYELENFCSNQINIRFQRLTLEEATQNMIAHSNQPEPEGARECGFFLLSLSKYKFKSSIQYFAPKNPESRSNPNPNTDADADADAFVKLIIRKDF